MKFLEASFERKHGELVMNQAVHNETMTPEIFRQVRGGQPATPDEIRAANLRHVPDGFTIWRTKYGDLRAIKVEHL